MSMDDRSLQKVKILLQDAEVQGRVRENIRKGREETKVTIGQASELFDIKQSKLRELDALLQPGRLAGTEQRQYSLAELQKLAIISELIRVGCAVADIPSDIERLWQEVAGLEMLQERGVEKKEDDVQYLPINSRIEAARKKLFWRYFASHALRLSLSLICEDIPNSPAGLILPLSPGSTGGTVDSIKDLPKLGESLVGWLSQSRSSHTLLTSRPSFEYESDYSLLRLTEMKDDEPLQPPKDNTLIILNRQDRRSARLTLNAPTVETIRRLLAPLYENAEIMRECFGPGMCDALDPSTLIDSRTPDLILTGLAEIVVYLGGPMADGQNRWRFCCILLPNNTAPIAPLQQRSLIVRAQSKNSPHKVGGTSVPPEESLVGLSIRAFQSGHIVYRPHIPPNSSETANIAYQEEEGNIRSAIALPVGGEDGLPVASIYIASDEEDAFSVPEQRLLRYIGKMIEELLGTFDIRLRVVKRLGDIIRSPQSVDEAFRAFFSENDFVRDVEEFLKELKQCLPDRQESVPSGFLSPGSAIESDGEQTQKEAIALIAIDVDDQESIALKYGDLMMRNLSHEVGLRIKGELDSMFQKYKGGRLYHIYADRFYVLLRDIPFDQVIAKAKLLKKSLDKPYKVSVLSALVDQLLKQDISITVRLAVSSFTKETLLGLLSNDPDEIAAFSIRWVIDRSLSKELKKGMAKGGDVIMAWNPDIREFEQLPMDS